MDAEPFTYHRQGRSYTALITLVSIWSVLVVITLLLDAALWLVGLLALFTFPALLEFVRNPAAGLVMDASGIRWHTGRRSASVTLEEIEKVRLDTRLDFSVRVTLILTGGQRLRLPYEATPPHQAFETALHARGIKTERHHFSLIG
ncbi:hypothetical protein [uncultured Roseobacter sp.]|uniref:hypothetical protein n=1 Tax=uncultured Roseobacter sp. TaxID=114847 RepID=UPI002618EB17|nr:hypothetical protein [uncultured Roseobacter sp.]